MASNPDVAQILAGFNSSQGQLFQQLETEINSKVEKLKKENMEKDALIAEEKSKAASKEEELLNAVFLQHHHYEKLEKKVEDLEEVVTNSTVKMQDLECQLDTANCVFTANNVAQTLVNERNQILEAELKHHKFLLNEKEVANEQIHGDLNVAVNRIQELEMDLRQASKESAAKDADLKLKEEMIQILENAEKLHSGQATQKNSPKLKALNESVTSLRVENEELKRKLKLMEAKLTKRDSELNQINGHYRKVLESDNTRMLDIERMKEESMESQPSAKQILLVPTAAPPTLKRDAEDGQAVEVDQKLAKMSTTESTSSQSPPTGPPESLTTGAPEIPPTGEPGIPPTEPPGIQPTGQPGNPPSKQPGSPLTGQPGILSNGQPGSPPTGEPGILSSGQPGSPPTGEPGILSSRQPGSPPTGEPGNPSSGQPGIPPTTQPGSPPTRPPGSQPTGPPESAPIGEPASPPTGKPGIPPTTPPGSQPTGPPESAPIGEPASPPTGQPGIPPTGKPVSLQTSSSASSSSAPSASLSTAPPATPRRGPGRPRLAESEKKARELMKYGKRGRPTKEMKAARLAQLKAAKELNKKDAAAVKEALMDGEDEEE
ncbi:hypothetical protein CAEBREN_16976 [Caenorhabditis brenneri]|uniref:Uncharacterized protein n=1 Tax=Caenorhabditis brenneri TaxID=135651 RepID=G0NZI9_CAEBE|nr:hypothetical protein CAEBREN_16976 [Caenorhabditis brenneri]